VVNKEMYLDDRGQPHDWLTHIVHCFAAGVAYRNPLLPELAIIAARYFRSSLAKVYGPAYSISVEHSRHPTPKGVPGRSTFPIYAAAQ